MRSKCITRQPDYNCYTHEPDGSIVHLIGGKFDATQAQRVTLPYMVRVGWDSKLNRHWLNTACEGFYDWSEYNGAIWFERDSDALLTRMVWG